MNQEIKLKISLGTLLLEKRGNEGKGRRRFLAGSGDEEDRLNAVCSTFFSLTTRIKMGR